MNNSSTFIYSGGETYSIEDLPVVVHSSIPNRTWTCGIQKKTLILMFSAVGTLAIIAISLGIATSGYGSTVKVETVTTVPSSNSGKNQDNEMNMSNESNIQKKPEQPNLRPKIDICETEACKESAKSLLEDMDLTANPCEDFFRFACGSAYDKYVSKNMSHSKFDEVYSSVKSRVKILLESEVGPDDLKPLQDFRVHYSSCLDTDTMDSLGLGPLIQQLEVQGGWPLTMDQWNSNEFVLEEALAHIRKINADPLVKAKVHSDFLNTTRKIFYVLEGSLGLNSFMLLHKNFFPNKIDTYINYISEAAKLIRDEMGSDVTDEKIKSDATDMVNFEIALSKIMDLKNQSKTDISAKTTIGGLQNITDTNTSGQISWIKFFTEVFKDTTIKITSEEPLYIYGTSFFEKLSTLLAKVSKRTLANYLGWFWVKNLAKETTYKMRNVSFNYDEYHGSKNRESHCSSQTEEKLAFPLSRAYVDKYFLPKAKEQTTLLIGLIRNSFQNRLNENTWMAPDDLAVAKEKLDAIVDYVGYPDWILNDAMFVSFYQKLNIVSGQHFENLIQLYDFYNIRQLSLFRISQSKVFVMSPLEVNAFYDVFSNLISILAGILQPPFYRYDTLAALNLGAIGTVVGHEFTHGFDNSGRHFDKDGNLASWWSEETVKTFTEKSQCFVDQYSNYFPPELLEIGQNISVNGNLTLGENIADNGGIRESFTGYMTYIEKFGEEPRLPGLEQFTPEELFFIGFSNVWCEYRTPDGLKQQIKGDPHSPARFRVLGSLSNSEDFAKTFNCPIGSPMNRGSERCILW